MPDQVAQPEAASNGAQADPTRFTDRYPLPRCGTTADRFETAELRRRLETDGGGEREVAECTHQ